MRRSLNQRNSDRIPLPGLRRYRGEQYSTVVLRSSSAYRRLLLDVNLNAPRESVVTSVLAARLACPSREGIEVMTLADRHWLIAQVMLADGISSVEAPEVCSACGELLELRLDMADAVRSAEPAVRNGAQNSAIRLPTARDLEKAQCAEDLLIACAPGNSVTPGEAEQLLRDADPLGDIALNADCFRCGNAIRTEIDLAARWLSGVRRAGSDLLEEIHVLASHYHWPEREILALPDARRLAYIEMCSAVEIADSPEIYVYS